VRYSIGGGGQLPGFWEIQIMLSSVLDCRVRIRREDAIGRGAARSICRIRPSNAPPKIVTTATFR
jgi:hypothetical protein